MGKSNGKRQQGLTDEQAVEVLGWYEGGESASALARAFGVDSSTIRRAIRRQGGQLRSLSDAMTKARRSLTDEQEAEVFRRYEAGESGKALRAEFHVDHPTIRRIVQEHGGRVRGRGEAGSGTARRLTDEQEAEVLRRYEAGCGSLRLSREFPVHHHTILKIVRRLGGRVRSRAGPRRAAGPRLTDGQRAEILRRYEAGESGSALGAAFGVSHTTVHETVRRLGGDVRRSGRAAIPRFGRQADEVLRRYEAGESTQHLAREFDASPQTIIRIVRQRGGQVRSRGRPARR